MNSTRGSIVRLSYPAMRRLDLARVVSFFPFYNEVAPFELRRRSENSPNSAFVLEDGCEGSVVASRQVAQPHRNTFAGIITQDLRGDRVCRPLWRRFFLLQTLLHGGVSGARDPDFAEYPKAYTVHRYPYREVPPITPRQRAGRQNRAVDNWLWPEKGPYFERIIRQIIGVFAKFIYDPFPIFQDLRILPGEGLRPNHPYGSHLVSGEDCVARIKPYISIAPLYNS